MTQQPRTPTTDPLVEAWRRWTESLTDPGRPTTGMLARDAFAAGWDAARADLLAQIEKADRRIDALRIAMDEAVELLNLVWDQTAVWEETKGGWIGVNDRLIAAIAVLQKARTAQERWDWHAVAIRSAAPVEP